ncbi:MAG: DUF4294 domain-containing protein [Bacteroidetes bacterium]|nr:DUF4294 domain-containing protein [Bacteroidota bacterium]
MKYILSFVCLFFVGFLSAQETNALKGIPVRAVIVDGDTMPYISLNEVRIVGDRIFKNKKQQEIYWKLKRDVKKVYPYAIMAEAKLKEYNAKLATMKNEIERKRYMKTAEEELKQQFAADLKKLTVTQGKILIKLIDRQTGETSYELVKDLRGSFSAFMWQSLASLFGSSLKSEYDPKGKDKMIEDVIYLIESGEI